RAVACLRTELSAFLCSESSSQGRHADYRAGPRLQKVERVSDPQALAFEIRRVGCSCLEEDPLKLGMHLSNPTMEFLSQVRRPTARNMDESKSLWHSVPG